MNVWTSVVHRWSETPYLVDVRGSLADVNKVSACGHAIISDGNDSFIGAFLKENDMEQSFPTASRAT